MMNAILRVDAHHHVWDLTVRDQPWTTELPPLRRSFGFAELRPHLQTHDVDGTVLVQTITVAEETPELLDLATREPMVLGVVGWVHLAAPGVADRLAELRAAPGGQRLVGIRHQVQEEPDPRWLCRPDVRRGLAAVADAGLAYDLLITPPQFDAAIETVAALPELRFVLDHAGKPRIRDRELEPWRDLIGQLARHANVTCKLSGLVTEADWEQWTPATLEPYWRVVLDAFGPSRILFGSDWPVALLASSYQRWVETVTEWVAPLSESERKAIWGGTASRVYSL
jgi:L-fuconolactonase